MGIVNTPDSILANRSSHIAVDPDRRRALGYRKAIRVFESREKSSSWKKFDIEAFYQEGMAH